MSHSDPESNYQTCGGNKEGVLHTEDTTYSAVILYHTHNNSRMDNPLSISSDNGEFHIDWTILMATSYMSINSFLSLSQILAILSRKVPQTAFY
jgi:hypothetical protein